MLRPRPITCVSTRNLKPPLKGAANDELGCCHMTLGVSALSLSPNCDPKAKRNRGCVRCSLRRGNHSEVTEASDVKSVSVERI